MLDFVGDIFGGNSPNVSAPGMSQNTQDLQKMQMDALTKQGKVADMLLPYQLKNMGLNATMGADGAIQSISEDPLHAQSQQLQKQFMDMSMSQLQAQQANAPGANQITKLQQDRTLAALKGELPVNSALTRELGDQETILRDTLRRQLGTGFETSDPGIRSLATFNQRKNETMDAARRGDLSLSDQLSQARSAGTFGQGMSSGQLAEQLRGVNLGQLMSGSSSLSPFINNLNTPQQLGYQQQNLGLMASDATAKYGQQANDLNANIFGAGLGFFL